MWLLESGGGEDNQRMKLTKIRTSDKVHTVCEALRKIIGEVDMDWEKKDDKGVTYFHGTLNNLSLYVYPNKVEIGITRKDDKDGTIEEKKSIPLATNAKLAISILYEEIEQRFKNHGDISFFKEAYSIINEVMNPPMVEVDPKNKGKDNERPKLVLGGK